MRNEEYRSRLGIAQTVVERWPTGAAHVMVGWELATLGRHEDAMAEYRQGIDTYPVARFGFGSELFDHGQYADAITQLRAFIAAEPLRLEVIRAHLKIARALTELHQWPDAANECRQVLRMTPHNVEAHVFLADALAGGGELPEAIAEYQTYLALRPADVGAWTSLALAFIDADHVKEARATYQHAVTLAPNDARIRADYARTLLLDDDLPDALTEAQKAIALDPMNGADHDLLGRVYANERRWTEARRQYDLARGLNPHDDEAAQALAALDRVQ
jgi:tetratricopeptide (TPR) repeat protein